MNRLEDHLADLVAKGDLTHDPAQMFVAQAMDRLIADLQTYKSSRTVFLRLKQPPKGLYVWGGVGRGKTMLMNWFFDVAPMRRKQRVHFHAFMLDVHARIKEWRDLSTSERRASEFYVRGAKDDPIAPTAKSIALTSTLLCFDEFHVTDIADAMILSRLFEALWERGVIVVATSNRAPDDLYKNGLNRGLFEPFIDIMKDNMVIHALEDGTDHRLQQLEKAPVYYWPLDKTAQSGMNDIWARLTHEFDVGPETLNVQGRVVNIAQAGGGTARFDFKDVCEKALGAADYLQIARTYHTVLVDNVPKMGADDRNEAKRFVTFIDALYETQTNLIMSAEVAPNDLYTDGTGAFEFERTVSRLHEMQQKAYLAKAHDIFSNEMP